MTTVLNKTRGFNYYNVDGRELDDIVFYRDGAVIFHAGRGWLDEARSHYCKPDYLALVDLRRATKLNLSKGGHFYLSSKGRCTLYLDVSQEDVGLGAREPHLMYENDEHRSLIDIYKVTVRIDAKGTEQTVHVAVPNSHRYEHSSFGLLIKDLSEQIDKSSALNSVKQVVREPALLLLLVRAAAVGGSFEDIPTVQSALDNLAAALALSQA